MPSLLALPLLVAQLTTSPPSLPQHLAINATTLREFPRKHVHAVDEQGNDAEYSGVSLRDLLTKMGVPAGHAIRGKLMQTIVVVAGSDGYRVAFSISELDPSFTDRIVLVAELRAGAPFSALEGPYRLIVPGEKRGARWARQVTEVDVEGAP